jgi:hypothetical protein
MAEDFADLMAELRQRVRRDGPPPDDEARQTQLALEDMKRTVCNLILKRVSLRTLELSLLYHWLHIATLNRFITDPEFKALASNLDMVGERLITTLKQTAAGIDDGGPSASMRERGEMIEQLRAAARSLNSDAPLPQAEVVRQSELTNREIWMTISEWLMKEINPTIIEGTLLYHFVRTSTIHANVPEEFFQKLERNWPQVMEQVGTLVDQLMQTVTAGRFPSAL